MCFSFALLKKRIRAPSPKYLQTEVLTILEIPHVITLILGRQLNSQCCLCCSNEHLSLDSPRCQEHDTHRFRQMSKTASMEQNFLLHSITNSISQSEGC